MGQRFLRHRRRASPVILDNANARQEAQCYCMGFVRESGERGAGIASHGGGSRADGYCDWLAPALAMRAVELLPVYSISFGRVLGTC